MNNETRDLGMQFDDVTSSNLTQDLVDSHASNSGHQLSSIYSNHKNSTNSEVTSPDVLRATTHDPQGMLRFILCIDGCDPSDSGNSNCSNDGLVAA
jgi:hypothetical protein